jgi:hypothetical protein
MGASSNFGLLLNRVLLRILCNPVLQVALSFVNDSCASTHGNIRVNSIFISASGEWKLGGFEMFSSPKDDAAVLYVRGSIVIWEA